MTTRLMLVAVILAITVSTPHVMAQSGADRVIARVGNEVITRKDFRDRYEAAVWIGKDQPARLQPARHAFLLSLIAEKLLAGEGARRGLHDDYVVGPILAEIERMLTLDALYRSEVKNFVLPAEEDIDAFLRLYSTQAAFSYVVIDSLSADTARTLLVDGVSMEDLAQALDVVPGARTMRWGELYAPIEEALFYHLQPGQLSHPIPVEGEWYIVRLDDLSEQVFATQSDREYARENVARVLREREEKRRFADFMSTFGAGRTAEVDEGLFYELVAQIESMLHPTGYEDLDVPARRVLRQPEYRELQGLFERREEDALVRGGGREIPLGFFLERLNFKGFALEHPMQRVDVALRDLLREVIAEQWLVEEGYSRGMDRLPEVVRDLSMWRQSYTSRRMNQILVDSLSRTFEGRVFEVRYRSALAPELATATRLVEGLAAGIPLGDLMRQFPRTQPGPSMADGGFALAPMIHPDALIAWGQDYAGPFETNDGWMVVSIDGRREPPDARAALDTVIEDRFARHIARLAEKAVVSIDLVALEDTPVTALNMIAVRFLGFNQRLLAVPTLARMIEWFDHVDQASLYPGL
jgi:hypothetical protein